MGLVIAATGSHRGYVPDRFVLELLTIFHSDAWLFRPDCWQMLIRVKVIDLAETSLTMRQAILRDSPGVVFQLAFMPLALIHLDWWIAFERGDLTEIPRWFLVLGFGALLMFLLEVVTTNKKRRPVHDFIAESVVVKLYNQPI